MHGVRCNAGEDKQTGGGKSKDSKLESESDELGESDGADDDGWYWSVSGKMVLLITRWITLGNDDVEKWEV